MIRKLDKNSEFNSPIVAMLPQPQPPPPPSHPDFAHHVNNQHCSSNEFSLLERYLNNEQIVASKHAQCERILEDWLRASGSGGGGGGDVPHKVQSGCNGVGVGASGRGREVVNNMLLIDNYSIIDYILNQEGISMRTFAQLIREKFDYMEWPREIIVELYRVVNGDVLLYGDGDGNAGGGGGGGCESSDDDEDGNINKTIGANLDTSRKI